MGYRFVALGIMSDRFVRLLTVFRAAAVSAAAMLNLTACAEPPPTLETIYPPGATAGSTVAVEVAGGALTGLKTLRSSIPGAACEVLDNSHCRLKVPQETPPGLYDVWAVTAQGISAPRTFAVSRRREEQEAAANDLSAAAMPVALGSVINGRIEQPGDLDYYRFEAQTGQRLILECWAERIDSRLRAVLEVFDADGQRLAVNRGYYGLDPLIDFRVPADGAYFVKIADLVYSGGADQSYRLEIDAGPRVAFTVPNVIPRGQSSRIQVFGWNLTPGSTSTATTDLDQVEVVIPAAMAQDVWPLPVRVNSHQFADAGFAYHHPDSQTAVVIGLTDVPVQLEGVNNHAATTAQPIPVPCEVSGRLVSGDERDWFAIDARRGEVFHFEVLSQRFGAPTDLQLNLWNAAGDTLLAEWNDEQKNVGGLAFPTSHLDPSGRWVAPADGRFLLMVSNLSGGLSSDPRRSYRLCVRREEPDVQLVAIPKSAGPLGFNLRKGGRIAFDVFALRQRGLNDTIRIAATDMPRGIECPDIVLGPGADHGTMVVSAEPSVVDQLFSLNLQGHADSFGRRPVRGGTVIRAGQPHGWSRWTSDIPLAVTGEAPVRVTAAIRDQLNHHLYGKLRLRSAPGSVLDVAVTVEQRIANHKPAVKLTAVGLPAGITPQTALIPAGSRDGTISFLLPQTLPVGQYSFAIVAETTVPTADGKTAAATVISNAITISVEPAGFTVELDPFTPRRVKRGETFLVNYATPRINGFIGKIHTELASPGTVTDVPGLRGRGVTFVGQSETGSIQIVVNDDAPLGPLPFLRLFAVGVLEDQPTHFGAAWLPLEVVE